MQQSLIDQDLGASSRRDKFKRFSKLALDLSIQSAEGQCDYFIASQLGMLVRDFSQAVDPSESYPDIAAVLDFLGMSIQTAVGKASKPEGMPAMKAVSPIHETALEPVASGGRRSSH